MDSPAHPQNTTAAFCHFFLVTPLLRCNATPRALLRPTFGEHVFQRLHIARTARERRDSSVTPRERCHETGRQTFAAPRRAEKRASYNPDAVVDTTREARDDTSRDSGHTGRRRGILKQRKDGRQCRIPPEWNPRGRLAFFRRSMIVFPKSGFYWTAFRNGWRKRSPSRGAPGIYGIRAPVTDGYQIVEKHHFKQAGQKQ